MKDGLFTSKVNGFHGPITVETTIKKGKIKLVSVKNTVPNTVGETAAKIMAQRITKAHDPKVDAISTASYSSNAVKIGVEKDLKISNGEIDADEALKTENSDLRKPKTVKYPEPDKNLVYENQVHFEKSYDMIVAGAGVSGLAAAIMGSQLGLKTMVFEKAGMSGGTSKYSEGEVQAAGTFVQKEFSKFKNDTADKHLAEMKKIDGDTVDQEIIADYAQDGAEMIQWLADMGIKWAGVFAYKGVPYIKRSQMVERIHYYENGGEPGSGIILTNTMVKQAKKNGVNFKFNSPVVNLVLASPRERRVVGVIIEHNGKRHVIKADKGVVLATSGLDHNSRLSKQFSPIGYRDLKRHQINTADTDTGDGIAMGLNIGAAVCGFGAAVGAVTRLPQAKNIINTVPAIYVNGLGNRYINEELGYGIIGHEDFQQEDDLKHLNWAIFNTNLLGMQGTWRNKEDLEKDIKKGNVIKAENIEELSKKIKVPSNALNKTIKEWNRSVQEGEDDQFHRTLALTPLKKPYYAYKLIDQSVGTIGGLKVNANQQVIDNMGSIIKGLYAAGMNAGGAIGNIYFGSGLALGTGIHGGRRAAKTIAGKSPKTTTETIDVTSGASEKE